VAPVDCVGDTVQIASSYTMGEVGDA
jgi:hypothetical protein